MQFMNPAVINDGVAGVVAALKADHVIGFGRVIIHHFALAFITPLRTDNHDSLPLFFHT